MRRVFSFLGIVAFSVAAFNACNKVSEIETPENGKHVITMTTVMGETRTALSEEGDIITMTWSDPDVDKFHVWENGVPANSLTTTLNGDKTIATITGTFENSNVSPFVYSSCFAKELNSGGNPIVQSIQDASLTSIDPSADLLIGEDVEKASRPDELLVTFTRPVALNKMTIKGLEVGEYLTSVMITSKSGKLTGAYDRSQKAFDFTEGEESILVSCTNVPVANDGTAPVFFVSVPVENAILEVEVWTTKGGLNGADEHHYLKTFTRGITLPANMLSRFTANLTCCEVVEGSTEEITIFKETWDKTDGHGGNDNKWSGSIASSAIQDDHVWYYSHGGGADRCVKLGASGSAGSASSPALGISAATATITFKAAAWDQETTDIELAATGSAQGVTISSISPSARLKNGEWGTYTATISGANPETEIIFSATNNRFFLDEVEVKEVRTSDPNTVTLEVEGTEIEASETEATISISSNKAWTVTSDSEYLEGTPISINGTAQTSSFTVSFANENTSATDAKVATLHVVAGAGSYAQSKDITVTQKAKSPSISIPSGEKTQTVSASATSASFTVNSNFDWDVISITVDGEPAGSGYSATKGSNGTVAVIFPSNEANGVTTIDRLIEVTVGDTNIKTTSCKITQQGETYVDPNKKYFVEVTTEPTDWSGHYLIVSGTTAMPGNNVKDQSGIGVTVDVGGNMIEATATTKPLSFTISKSETAGKYIINSLSGYIGRNYDSNGIEVSTTPLNNTIEFTDGVHYILGESGRSLRFNSNYFRYYGTKNQGNAIRLYKFNGETSDLFIGQLTMSNIECTNNGQNTSTLEFGWDAVAGAIGYQVSEDGVTYGSTQTTRTYTISGLEPGTTKSIWVKAIGDGTFYSSSTGKQSAVGTTKTDGGDGRTYSYTFTTKAWASSETVSSGTAPGITWTGSSDGGQLTSGQGVQVTTSQTGVTVTSSSDFTSVSRIVITYCTNASKGAGTINVKVGSGSQKSFSVTKTGGTALRTCEFNYSTTETGNVSFTVDCTTNSIYINKIEITAN